MRDYTLSQQFALVGFDGLEALHTSVEKSAVLRGIGAARILEEYFLKEIEEGGEYQAQRLKEKMDTALDQIRKMKKNEAKELEQEVTALLKAAGDLEEGPDLLGSDMDYVTSGVGLRAYRTSEELYTKITEGVRAEILEEGVVTEECLGMLWLFRETGCIHQIFSVSEQEQVERRMVEQASRNPVYGVIWNLEFHRSLESFAVNFLQNKKALFKNPYLEGINLMYPFLDRRQAVFIDCIILGRSVAERRLDTMSYLLERGHHAEEVKYGEETLLKIDNGYYRIFPGSKWAKFPIQGVYLIPVYK